MNRPADALLLPTTYSRIVARLLALQEKDLPALLRGTGLPVSVLLPGDETRISGEQQLRILENGRRMLDTPDFGLRLGEQLQPASHGPLGYLALASPDLVTALESLRDFLPVRIPLVSLTVEREGRWLNSTLHIQLPAGDTARRVLQESFALVIQSVAESLLGRELREARIELAHPRPHYHALYADYLHSPVHFARAQSRVCIPVELAESPNSSGDPASFELAQDMCQQLLDEVPAAALSTTDQVRRLLLSQPQGALSESELASMLFISRRTLARRLQREGQSYRALRENLLSELAARQLRETGLTVEAVAALLGYNDSAAFRKAFRRWYGMSPAQFRGPAA